MAVSESYQQMQGTEIEYKPSLLNSIRDYLKDARHFQILYLSLFLVYGVSYLHWEISVMQIGLVMGTCLMTQLIWVLIIKGSFKSLKSALITSLGILIILQSTSMLTLVLAGVIAISSKFVLRIKNKHLFNPGNFGIIASILIFGDAWISPGQWGSDALFLFVISAFGAIVLLKIGRLETTMTFLLSLFAMEFIRTVLYQGWSMDVLLHKFSSGTFLLFAFFMITDPMTIPNSRKGRILWSFILASATFILSNWLQIYTAPIWVLFFMTPVTVLFDKIWPELKFEWIKSPIKN